MTEEMNGTLEEEPTGTEIRHVVFMGFSRVGGVEDGLP